MQGMVTVKRVESKADRRRFVDFPNQLYKDNPNFVPATYGDDLSDWDPKTNPAFSYCDAQCFLAYRDGKIVGRIGAILLCLIGAALALSIFITIVSYRINLMDKARPKLHRFVKMTKYLFQLVASAITIFLVISTVQNTNVFSLIISSVSVPFLLWSFFVNVFAELLEHALGGFGKKVYVPQPAKNEDGEEIDVRTVIANIDGTANTVKQMKKRQSAPKV